MMTTDPSRRRFLKLGMASLAVPLAACGDATSEAPTQGEASTATPSLVGPTQSVQSPLPPEAPPAIQGGAWQALTFPTIQRRLVGNPSAYAGTTFDPAPAIAVDALTPNASSVVPYRAFCRATMGEPGVLYYHGALHSDYAGNEIDRIDLRDFGSQEVGLSINHQPVVPPAGPQSGYASGSGAYLYRQYGNPPASSADWQPYAFHNWCNNSWHPAHGYLLYTNYAVENGAVTGPNPAGQGSGYPVSSKLAYPSSDPRQVGFVRYYKNSRYEKVTNSPAGALAGTSDYAAYRQSMLAFCCDQYNIQVFELVGSDWRLHDSQSVAAISTGITGNYWYAGASNNGVLVRHMDRSRYLVYTIQPPAQLATTLDPVNYAHQVYVYDADAKRFTRVLLGPNIVATLRPYTPNGDGLLSFSVDRAARRVYCVAVDGARAPGSNFSTGPLRLWVSGFDDLATWSEMALTDVPTVSANFAIDREPLKIYNGFLFFLSKVGEGAQLHRVKITAGEPAPRFEFHRHDYAQQDFRLAAPLNFGVLDGKHACFAYRETDGRYYQMAGDIVESYIQSTFSVAVSPTSYQFRQELDELTPAPVGYVRPACTDDGAWAYCGASNANPALADKFIWARGGDGLGFRSNAYMLAKYSSDADAMADRWTQAKFVIYDPANKRFMDAGIESWPVSKGTDPVAHPSMWPSNYARNGVFDPSTNTFFRFANGRLAAFNFDTRTIRIWNVFWWRVEDGAPAGGVALDNYIPPADSVKMVDDPAWPQMYYYDSGATRNRTFGDFTWEHQALWIDSRDGRLYVVSPGTGYLWCFETRGVERTDRDGNLTIPFYPLGRRIPLDGHFPGANWDLKMHSYLVPFKGGLFYTCDNPSGNDGTARYAFWRRLGYQGDWTPITLPADWAANSVAGKSAHVNNDEILGVRAHAMARNGESRATAFYLVK